MSIVYEFDNAERAEAFTAAVKGRFDLDGRVFESQEALDAYNALHRFNRHPFRIERPFLHVYIDRVESDDDVADAAAERQIEVLAERDFGGEWIGT